MGLCVFRTLHRVVVILCTECWFSHPMPLAVLTQPNLDYLLTVCSPFADLETAK